ncbi:MAG: hypothetical protein ABEJ03_00785 [Candidatus Nanohaloarchaea archaeon]
MTSSTSRRGQPEQPVQEVMDDILDGRNDSHQAALEWVKGNRDEPWKQSV